MIGGQFIDLDQHEGSVEQSFGMTVSNQGQQVGGGDFLAGSDLEGPLASDETHIFESS